VYPRPCHLQRLRISSLQRPSVQQLKSQRQLRSQRLWIVRTLTPPWRSASEVWMLPSRMHRVIHWGTLAGSSAPASDTLSWLVCLRWWPHFPLYPQLRCLINSWFATQGVPKGRVSCGNQTWKGVWNWPTRSETSRGSPTRLCSSYTGPSSKWYPRKHHLPHTSESPHTTPHHTVTPYTAS
jgi:hypothetical protein